MNPVQTILTLTFDDDLSRDDALEFSRHYAAHMSSKKGVSDVRMQLFVGDPLTDSQARLVAEIPRHKAREDGHRAKQDGTGLCQVCGLEVPVTLPTKAHSDYPHYVTRSHYPEYQKHAFFPGSQYYCRGSNLRAVSVKVGQSA